nr:MAG TPA: Glycosyltransferase [Caudoviricetes sp.]
MTVHVIGIEPIESRYTLQWDTLIPEMMYASGANVEVYRGNQVQSTVGNSSDFLAWVPTNIWKLSQASKFAEAITEGKVKSGDVVFITDFWNPCVLNIKYMADLSNINLTIIGYAHAGIYDPHDRLAMLSETEWGTCSEKAIIGCYDNIVFATQFHLELFEKTHGKHDRNIVLPFFGNYIKKSDVTEKENLVVFCQRHAPEKQPHMFKELKLLCSDMNLEWLDLSENPLPNAEYIEVLKRAKYFVSFALQETLGIGAFEALSNRCMVILPDRLSYSEMYEESALYCDDKDNDAINASDKLRWLETMSRAKLDDIINENYNKASKFFDGSRTAEYISRKETK